MAKYSGNFKKFWQSLGFSLEYEPTFHQDISWDDVSDKQGEDGVRSVKEDAIP